MDELGTPVKVSFAQNREDVFLEYFLKDVDNGFYVDIGANDPVADSVTKLFYDKGWNGINIEPIKRLCDKLQKQRPKDTSLNISIGDKEGVTSFREYRTYHGLSTMAPTMQKDYQQKVKTDKGYADYIDYEVQVKKLSTVFNEQKVKHIHFMKVDVEGFEYEVLNSNDWKRYRPEVICIEANHIVRDWRPLLKQNDYAKAYNDGLNDYYVAKEASKRSKDFSYVEAALPMAIVPYPLASAINVAIGRLKAERSTLVSRNTELAKNAASLNHALTIAHEELRKLHTMKGILKTAISHLNRAIEGRIFPQHLRFELAPLPKNTFMEQGKTLEEQLAIVVAYDNTYLTKIGLVAHPWRRRVLNAYQAATKPVSWLARKAYSALRRLKGVLAR